MSETWTQQKARLEPGRAKGMLTVDSDDLRAALARLEEAESAIRPLVEALKAAHPPDWICVDAAEFQRERDEARAERDEARALIQNDYRALWEADAAKLDLQQRIGGEPPAEAQPEEWDAVKGCDCAKCDTRARGNHPEIPDSSEGGVDDDAERAVTDERFPGYELVACESGKLHWVPIGAPSMPQERFLRSRRSGYAYKK